MADQRIDYDRSLLTGAPRRIDRLGFGDTRVEFGVQAIESQWCDMVLSLYATLPTAFSIFKGIAGNTYKAPATYPNVPFEELYAAALAGDAGFERCFAPSASE